MDKNIQYVTEAKEHHECSEVEYQDYMESMEYMLDKQLNRLKQTSTNNKLIQDYQNKIFALFD